MMCLICKQASFIHIQFKPQYILDKNLNYSVKNYTMHLHWLLKKSYPSFDLTFSVCGSQENMKEVLWYEFSDSLEGRGGFDF